MPHERNCQITFKTITALVLAGWAAVIVACGPNWYSEIEGEGPGFETINIVDGRQFCKLLVLGNFDEWRPSGYPLHVVAAYAGGTGTILLDEAEDANASFEFRVIAGQHSSYGYSSSQGALLVPPGQLKITVLESHDEADWSFKCRMLDGDGGGP